MSLIPHSKLSSYYEANKHLNWVEWLDYTINLQKPSKQGIVGLMKPKHAPREELNEDDAKIASDEFQYIFKFSQDINHIIEHESSVMSALNDISAYCPHFCKFVGNILVDVEPMFHKNGNPFIIESKYALKKPALLCEYIDNSTKFYNYITSNKISDDIIFSSIKQILLALCIAQKKKKFTHYDLHSYNILMRTCEENTMFLYVIDDNLQFVVPTYGYIPIIIDFGFSYIQDLDGTDLNCTLAHTEAGYTCDRFDWLADPKLFLISVNYELIQHRNSRKAQLFNNLVKTIFKNLKVDWKSGWDKNKNKSAIYYVINIVKKIFNRSVFFDKYDYYCFDILQSLIIQPTEEQDFSEIVKVFKCFLKQWKHIEDHIKSDTYKIYALKKIVDTVKAVRYDYLVAETEQDRLQSILQFKNLVLDSMRDISKFCTLDKLNFETLLVSLIMLGKCIEGVLYSVMTEQKQEKYSTYDKVKLKNIEQIFSAIDVNIQTPFTIDNSTKIYVFDSVAEKYSSFHLPTQHIDKINNTPSLFQGTELYSIYKQLINAYEE